MPSGYSHSLSLRLEVFFFPSAILTFSKYIYLVSERTPSVQDAARGRERRTLLCMFRSLHRYEPHSISLRKSQRRSDVYRKRSLLNRWYELLLMPPISLSQCVIFKYSSYTQMPSPEQRNNTLNPGSFCNFLILRLISSQVSLYKRRIWILRSFWKMDSSTH